MNAWTERDIKGLLDRSDKAVMRAVVAIYKRQTNDERMSHATRIHNGVGFNQYDAAPLSSIAESIVAKHYVSPSTVEFARRRIKRYWRQLVDLANASGKTPTAQIAPAVASATATISRPCDCEWGDGEPVACVGREFCQRQTW